MENITNLKNAAMAKALNSDSTRMPAVRCRRHKYASIIACCPIINNDIQGI
jgi:hypothetical protein